MQVVKVKDENEKLILLMLYSDLAAHASARMGVRTLLVRLDTH